ncbi:methylmalonyl Co-A mutase-associated GTPase MeaB [Hyphomicrobium sp.]|uniref:methylmalonyl Co-A mutase-associated GTPase MeaB n=1 Tax=Hyphomicrobium sp. TaxID=82 RepID=UPI0025B9E76A|nr:methylmalonyl Co-A mutase-associated GTPase MeaB [Hyphomicrobium sp.]MCC7250502.1 methylmalonyl Co-A mutase-associated GTPase MeaB [Hyphomicrobium sp.]
MDGSVTEKSDWAAQTKLSDRDMGKAISRAERADDTGESLDESLWTTLPTKTQIIGVTGPPGAGKSTLADKLIACARAQGLKVGVLAIDPSSPFSGGAILGDRVRMGGHAADPNVFIRSMGSRTNLGGLAAATRSAVRLLAENGVDVVILETVGVGQAELEIMHVADTVIVVVVPGLGDAVQMSKAGILEIADAFVVNQSDRPEAKRTKAELEQALMIGHKEGEMTTVTMTQATNGDGVDELWKIVRSHFERQVASGVLSARRLVGQRQEISDQVKKKIFRDLHAWLSGEEFLRLLHSKSSGAWTVNDLTTRASAAFLDRFRDPTRM